MIKLAILGLAAVMAAGGAVTSGVGSFEPSKEETLSKKMSSGTIPVVVAPITNDDRLLYRGVAEKAWRYLDENYETSTGFVKATPDWRATTLWDIGGQILAYMAAKELGLLTESEFNRRTGKTLSTLEKLDLVRGAAFNRVYSTETGRIEGTQRGWSATDLGRLFVALKILSEREPQYKEISQRIVKRNNFNRITQGGYLRGEMTGSRGKPWNFQEGRIGYEQYAAKGFDFWGGRVNNALDLKKNAEPVKVLGIDLYADKRWQDRLLSEPFILQAIEVGLTPEMDWLANNLLRVQEERYKQMGKITISSEDALGVAPHYFYYYCVYCSRKPFVVEAVELGKVYNIPGWVSTKGAMGWHAIKPSAYTEMAVEYVGRAWDVKKGWASGVYEVGGQSTNTYDINTAAVLMEIAWFKLRGSRPFIESAAVAGP